MHLGEQPAELRLLGGVERSRQLGLGLVAGAPTTVYELARFGGAAVATSNEPLTHPWSGRMDGTLLRELGFRPTVPTIHGAARDGIL
jgi:hypothetical protein